MPPEQQPQAPQASQGGAQQFQYRQLPDGKWGKYNANATEDEIAADMKSYGTPNDAGSLLFKMFGIGRAPSGPAYEGVPEDQQAAEGAKAMEMRFGKPPAQEPKPTTFLGGAAQTFKDTGKSLLNDEGSGTASGVGNDWAQRTAQDPVSGIPGVGPMISTVAQDPKNPAAWGSAAAQGVTAAAPLALGGFMKGDESLGTDISGIGRKGIDFLERTESPNGVPVGREVEELTRRQRAAPYIAQQQRESPVMREQPQFIGSEQNPLAGRDMGAANLRQNVQAATTKLWEENVTPRAQMYNRAPVDGAAIQKDILSTLDPAAQVDERMRAAVEDVANFHSSASTVGEALDQIRALNDDRMVKAYESAAPDKRIDMIGANPNLEARLTARESLRTRVFDSIEKHGNPEDADYMRQARGDMQALMGTSEKLGKVTSPVPQSMMSRILGSSRVSTSGSGIRESLFNAPSRVLDLDNPNRLAAKSSQLLGKSVLQPREAPPIRMTPWDPNMRPAPGPIVGPAGQTTPFTGGSPSPLTPPPVQPVGGPPAMGFQTPTPDNMWTGRSTPPQPTFEVPGRSVPSVAPGIQPTAVDLQQPTMSTSPAPQEPLSLPSQQPVVKSNVQPDRRQGESNVKPISGERRKPDVAPKADIERAAPPPSWLTKEANNILNDPRSTPRDKEIAQRQLADYKADPSLQGGGEQTAKDIRSARSKPKEDPGDKVRMRGGIKRRSMLSNKPLFDDKK